MEKLTYTQVGDYLIPNVILNEPPEEILQQQPLSKYGNLRKNYLREHRQILFNNLLLSEKLYPHLREIEETANRRLEQIMTELQKKNPAPDKATNQMAWIQHMNSLKAQAEEMILSELIYN